MGPKTRLLCERAAPGSSRAVKPKVAKKKSRAKTRATRTTRSEK